VPCGVVYLARLNSAEAGIGTPLLLPRDRGGPYRRPRSLFGGSGGLSGTMIGAITLDAGAERHNLPRHQLELAAPCDGSDHFARGPDRLLNPEAG
jgi:hypothetical protein